MKLIDITEGTATIERTNDPKNLRVISVDFSSFKLYVKERVEVKILVNTLGSNDPLTAFIYEINIDREPLYANIKFNNETVNIALDNMHLVSMDIGLFECSFDGSDTFDIVYTFRQNPET